MSSSPITFIVSAPHFVSPEEHRQVVQSTPASFSEIPPVLRHKQDDVAIEIDPSLEGITKEELGKGSLFVVENSLSYVSAHSGRGFQIQYPSITIHAISRSGSSPIVYCQLETSSRADGTEQETEEEDEDIATTEVRIVPSDPSAVDPIFEALSYCASLHPDPKVGMPEEDDEAFYGTDVGNFETFTGGPDEELSEVGRAALAHLESIIVYPEGTRPPISDENEEEFNDPEKETEKSAVVQPPNVNGKP